MRYLLLLALVIAGTARADVVDGVAAIVNEKVITYSDVRDYVRPIIAQLRRNLSGDALAERERAAKLDALDSLIERQLILDEFKTKGFSFPDSVVDDQMNEVIAQDFGGDRAVFIRTLQADNITLAQYREQIRDRVIVQAMRNRKSQNEVVVSPAKIEQYYKDHAADFRVEAKVKLGMILIKREPVPADTEDPRRKLATELLAKLDAGEKFSDLAKSYSEGKEAKDGGDFGWVGRDVLRQELGDAAFALKAGEHSRIVETPDGFYLLRVEDTKPATTRPLKEVRDEIERQLLQDQRTKMQRAWVKQLRSKAYVRVF